MKISEIKLIEGGQDIFKQHKIIQKNDKIDDIINRFFITIILRDFVDK